MRQVLDWDDPTISWEGRGADRGLRGIAIHGERVYLAASDEVFVFNTEFQLVESFTNPYLKHCHEIDIHDGRLYLTSTGFDSILEVDLESHEFVRGVTFRMESAKEFACRVLKKTPVQSFRVQPNVTTFDPNREHGPEEGDQLHINSVVVNDDGMHVSGRILGALLHVQDGRITGTSPTPFGTHNVIPVQGELSQGHMILNDTDRDAVSVIDEQGRCVRSLPLVRYDQQDLRYSDLPEDHARQAFGRGLCLVGSDIVVVGSSPATITAYSLSKHARLCSVNLTLDVRNAIHGLTLWPFEEPDTDLG